MTDVQQSVLNAIEYKAMEAGKTYGIYTDSGIEERFPLTDAMLSNLLSSFSQLPSETGLIDTDDLDTLKSQYYGTIFNSASPKSLLEETETIRVIVLLRSIEKLQANFNTLESYPNGNITLVEAGEFAIKSFDKLVKHLRRLEKNGEKINQYDVDNAQLALLTILIIASDNRDSFISVYNYRKRYGDVKIFQDIFSKIYSSSFDCYLEAFPEELKQDFLCQMSRQLEMTVGRLSLLQSHGELEIAQAINCHTLNSVRYIQPLCNKAQLINKQALMDFNSILEGLINDEDMKIQNVRNSIQQVKSLISRYSITSTKTNIFDGILFAIEKLKKIKSSSNSSNTLDIINDLKEQIKRQIEHDQLTSASSTLEQIKNLKLKASSEFTDQLTCLEQELAKKEPGPDVKDYLLVSHSSHNDEDKELYHILDEENSELRIKVKSLQEENLKLEAINNEYKACISKQENDMSDLFRTIMFGNPSIEDVVAGIRYFYPHVVWNDNINQQISACKYTDGRKLFKILDIICGPYYQALISGKPDTEAKNLFPCSGYSQNESKQIRNNKSLYSKRIFKVNGVQTQFGKHYTLGSDYNDQRCVQIYFNIERECLTIGYIGAHLPLS